MRGPRNKGALRFVTTMILGVLLSATLVSPAAAQQPRSGAALTSIVGSVEILRAGQTQWAPAVVGAQLVEGDDIRAFSGASAEMVLPDKSQIVLVENSRLHLTKMEFNPQQQSRLVLLHLAVGKLRAAISQAGITLVRARQSNFAISTPTAVAAARGTILWVFTDGQQNLMAVEPEPGVRIPSRIECITLAGTQRRRQFVLAGSMTADCGPPVPTLVQFQMLSNPFTAGASLGGTVVAPSTANVVALVTSTGPAAVQGVSGGTDSAPTGLTGPSPLGVNPPQPPACATDPCN